MNNIWVIDCDNDYRNVSLYAEDVIFLTKSGIADFNFLYGVALDETIISARLIVTDIEGDFFTPYLTVIGAEGLFVNEQLAKLLSVYDSVDILPLTIIHKGQPLDGNWFYCNPTTVLNIIDWDKSELTLLSEGNVLSVDSLVLEMPDEPLPAIFRVEGYESIPLITETLYQKLAKITNPGFDLLALEEYS